MPESSDSFEASAKSGKKCPVCDVALVMSERQGIEIDYCPECRGVWLDRGELDKIIKHSLQLQGTVGPEFGQPERGEYSYRDDKEDYQEAASYREDDGYRQDKAPDEESGYRKDNGSRVGNYGGSSHGGGHGGSSHGSSSHGSSSHGGSSHGGGHGGSRHGGGHGGSRYGGGHRGRSWLQDLFY